MDAEVKVQEIADIEFKNFSDTVKTMVDTVLEVFESSTLISYHCRMGSYGNSVDADLLNEKEFSRYKKHQMNCNPPEANHTITLSFRYKRPDGVVRTSTIFRTILADSHECCGKVYIWRLPVFENDYSSENVISKLNGLFLNLMTLLATYYRYSYLGFTQRSEAWLIKEARKLGFVEAVSFQNKRTGNDLSCMYKII